MRLASYDQALAAELRDLPKPASAAFAAACAERLLPAYLGYVRSSGRGDVGVVRAGLDLAWEVARAGGIGPSDPDLSERIEAAVRGCSELISDEPEAIGWQADAAVAAVVYALQAAADSGPGAAAYAARQVTDALDDHLLRSEIDATDPEADRKVWEHPLVEAEVGRRAEDLAELRQADDWRRAVDSIRSRAVLHPALDRVSGDS
jgi:hypothetical protein